MKRFIATILPIITLILGCSSDSIRELNFGEYLNSYHLRGEMIYFNSGIPVNTVALDEKEAHSYGSFKEEGVRGFLSSFSRGIDIYVGVVDNDVFNTWEISHRDLPEILGEDQYETIPNSEFTSYSDNFFGASVFYEGPDKNYLYSVGKKSVLNLSAIFLAEERIFLGRNGMDEATIFVADFSTVLYPDIADQKLEVDLPDSIQLTISSVKGMLHDGSSPQYY